MVRRPFHDGPEPNQAPWFFAESNRPALRPCRSDRDRSTRRIGGFPGKSAATDQPGSAQRRCPGSSSVGPFGMQATRWRNRERGCLCSISEKIGGSRREALTAKRSREGRDPVRAWVAGHRVGTCTDRKASPALPMRSDMREAKTDTGHRGPWLCGCSAAAWERRARARTERGGAGTWGGAGG